LLSAGVPVESYDVAFLEGTQWTCRVFAQGSLRCGTWRIRPGPRQVEAQATAETKPYVSRFEFRSKEGFDGVVFIGAVTASRPAVTGPRDLGDAAPGR
jgi:hypothetical protein